jgi:hypothetical protein
MHRCGFDLSTRSLIIS